MPVPQSLQYTLCEVVHVYECWQELLDATHEPPHLGQSLEHQPPRRHQLKHEPQLPQLPPAQSLL